jgi:hypothetical protein
LPITKEKFKKRMRRRLHVFRTLHKNRERRFARSKGYGLFEQECSGDISRKIPFSSVSTIELSLVMSQAVDIALEK